MRKLFFSAAFAFVMAASAQAQITLAKWGFEVHVPPSGFTNSTVSGLSPDVGSGTASSFHANPATANNSFPGNGSANSLNTDRWTIGDYYQFQLSTVGYSGISLSFDQASLWTGSKKFNLSYSTDGSLFTTFATDYLVLTNSNSANNSGSGFATSFWNATTLQSAFSLSFDLSSVGSINNASSVFFRLVSDEIPSGPSDRNWVDNFTVTAAQVPEPQSLFPLGGLGLLAWNYLRRRK
ncbi:MAG: hypothetical protein JWR19_3041 [Pedosphaera sp.]|nr:hypothetical protein [Pedosphaera sp.]